MWAGRRTNSRLISFVMKYNLIPLGAVVADRDLARNSQVARYFSALQV